MSRNNPYPHRKRYKHYRYDAEPAGLGGHIAKIVYHLLTKNRARHSSLVDRDEKKLHKGMKSMKGMTGIPYKRRDKKKEAPMVKVTEDTIVFESVEIIDEAKEVSEIGTKGTPYGAKPAKTITSAGQDEWHGNTPREQKIIDQYRRNTVTFNDVAGNGDDVYSGARQKRVDYPVAPGEDVKNYKDWLNQGIRPWGTSFQGPFVKEDYGYADTLSGPFYPITHHDLKKSWALQHVAPIGSVKSRKADGTSVLKHPDGTTHYIKDGETFFDNKQGDKNSTKYNVIVHTYNKGSNSQFVSNKSSLHGFVNTTHDETKAKDFHSKEHAENHVNYHKQHASVDTHMTIHEKRPAQKVKSDNLNFKKAADQYHAASKAAVAKGIEPESDVKVRVARQKMRKHTHPGKHSYY